MVVAAVEIMAVGVLQLLAVLASNVVKKGTGRETAPTQALEVEEGLAGVEGMGVERAGAMGAEQVGAMGVQQGVMRVLKGMEGAVLGAQVLSLVHAINVGSQDTGQRIAQIDRAYC